MFGSWAALPPEVNSFRLTFGPGGAATGAAPMLATAAAYTQVATGIRTAALGAQQHLEELMVTWRGAAATQAQMAFFQHLTWMHQNAALLDIAAIRATAQGAAYLAALAAMPPFPVVMANRATTAALVATNTMGQNTAPIAVSEAAYLTMWTLAANTMYAYAAQTAQNVVVPAPAPAPMIAGGPGAGPLNMTGALNELPQASLPGHAAPGSTDILPGNGSQTPTHPGTTPGGGESPGGNPNPSPGDQAVPTPDTPTDFEAPTDLATPAESAGLGSDTIDSLNEPGFYGASPNSATLAALQGGGPIGAIGMTTGGFNALPGTATGFRMPGNWAPSTGTPFSLATTPSSSVAPVAAAPRATSAPIAQSRRRTDESTERRVFAPGETVDVPELADAMPIGVIEYSDDETDAVSLVSNTR
ncbi:PPE domain-containing protein [Nocardia sp. NPDC005978]|uniref:PPE family protein n=1 Tax=Nocardia sp. NPDC005978 TaxID=3156725 RepID=UPI0033AA2547